MVGIVRHQQVHGIKLCHAKIGGIIGLINDMGQLLPDRYMVCEWPDATKTGARPLMSQGLYDSDLKMFLLNIETGVVAVMPNLSSRVAMFRDATFSEGAPTVDVCGIQRSRT